MKKYLLLTVMYLFLSSSAQSFPLVDVEAEMNLWIPDVKLDNIKLLENENSMTGHISFETSIPIIPNFKFGFSSLDSEEYQFSKVDYTVYYKVLDNTLVSLDLGLGATSLMFNDFIVGGVLIDNVDGYLPHIYLSSEVKLPIISVSLFGNIYYSELDNSKFYDFYTGVKYSSFKEPLLLSFQLGYRIQNFEMDDFERLTFNNKLNGFFLGINGSF